MDAGCEGHKCWSRDPGMLQPSQIHPGGQACEFWSQHCGDAATVIIARIGHVPFFCTIVTLDGY